jgi:inosine/xanthosine triphosphatase
MKFVLAILCITLKLSGGEKNMLIAVGSTNGVKVQAMEEVIKEYPTLSEAKIVSVATISGVSEQPLSLEETILGAKNRAENAFYASQPCQYGVGIEGGLCESPGTRTGFMTINICSIFDGTHHYVGFTSGYEVPPQILALMLNQKMDLSQACLHSGITSKAKIGAEEGLIGILTQGRVDRKKYTKECIAMALVQLENHTWYQPHEDLFMHSKLKH